MKQCTLAAKLLICPISLKFGIVADFPAKLTHAVPGGFEMKRAAACGKARGNGNAWSIQTALLPTAADPGRSNTTGSAIDPKIEPRPNPRHKEIIKASSADMSRPASGRISKCKSQTKSERGTA
jgi:hypothetical protein